MNSFIRICVSLFVAFFAVGLVSAQDKKVVFIPGPDSHGFGSHAHVGGVKLLADMINKHVPGLTAIALEPGWPRDTSVFDGAAALVVFSDGGDGSMLARNAGAVEELVAKGVGIGVIHYALEVPKGEPGNALLRAVGGYYEQFWSVNPWYEAEFKEFPNHPVARGLKPFALNDEWYYHMRFVPPGDQSSLTEILVCVPPDATRNGPDGSHSGNPTVREQKGRPECLCWVFERDTSTGKGRGFGFTGGHDHWNWGHPMFLKTVLNAVVWTTGGEVPESGIVTPIPTLDELLGFLSTPDELTPQQRNQIQRRLAEWKAAY
ncbi:MAG: ThuA domain-containing protein [Planctomycetaceae bacterium]|nr:ThuA domain-containing protein [Planctomycetaceae bacterium]